MASKSAPAQQALERVLSLEIVRVTERAAVAAARLRGRGAEKKSDQAAVDAMRRELGGLAIDGTVVIGEGEMDEAPMLFIGEKVGTKGGPKVDIAVDPLEGTTLCAKNMPGAIATLAMAKEGTLLQRRIFIWTRSRSAPAIPRAWSTSTLRPRKHPQARQGQRRQARRHYRDDPRSAAPRRSDRRGAQGRRRGKPDHRWRRGRRHSYRRSRKNRHRYYLGIGGAPEGVLAAAALRCIGGQMQTRLIVDTDEKRERVAKMGIKDPRKKYEIEDMVKGDCLFAATGVTDGRMLRGVRFGKDMIETETVVMRSVSGTVRWIRAEHRKLDKFA